MNIFAESYGIENGPLTVNVSLPESEVKPDLNEVDDALQCEEALLMHSVQSEKESTSYRHLSCRRCFTLY